MGLSKPKPNNVLLDLTTVQKSNGGWVAFVPKDSPKPEAGSGKTSNSNIHVELGAAELVHAVGGEYITMLNPQGGAAGAESVAAQNGWGPFEKDGRTGTVFYCITNNCVKGYNYYNIAGSSIIGVL